MQEPNESVGVYPPVRSTKGLAVRLARKVTQVLDWLQLRACYRSGFTSSWVDTSVGRVHALVREGGGTLPPVVLVHGLSSSAQDFQPVMEHLQSEYRRVIAVDLPGHGQSFIGNPCPTAHEMRTALAETIDAVLDEPAVVYGNSLGGYASLCLSMDRPEKVGRLLLGSPAGAPMAEEQLEKILGVFRMRSHKDAMAFMAQIMETRSWWTPLMAQVCLSRMTQPHMAAMLQAIAGEKLLSPEDLKSVLAPIVLIWGKGERLLPDANLAFFQENLPKETVFEYLEGAGHVPHADRPRWVCRELMKMAESLQSTGAQSNQLQSAQDEDQSQGDKPLEQGDQTTASDE